MKSIAIVGTGLIGTSVALALREAGYTGTLLGMDRNASERSSALAAGGFDEIMEANDDHEETFAGVELIVLATPVLAILDWMHRLAPVLGEAQLVTDVGSTKAEIARVGAQLFQQPDRARFLPGHPMAGKEVSGAAAANADLFRGAVWLFTPLAAPSPIEMEWRAMVESMGASTRDLPPAQHDEVCAWVSHLPQMVATSLAALLEDRFGEDPQGMAAVRAIGARALRESTRLGASPYSMWRDVALTNTEPIAGTLLALEQRLQFLRENLRTPGLRDEFETANRFRSS